VRAVLRRRLPQGRNPDLLHRIVGIVRIPEQSPGEPPQSGRVALELQLDVEWRGHGREARDGGWTASRDGRADGTVRRRSSQFCFRLDARSPSNGCNPRAVFCVTGVFATQPHIDGPAVSGHMGDTRARADG